MAEIGVVKVEKRESRKRKGKEGLKYGKSGSVIAGQKLEVTGQLRDLGLGKVKAGSQGKGK